MKCAHPLMRNALSQVISTCDAPMHPAYSPLAPVPAPSSSTRRVLITSSGAAILASLVSAHPLARLVIDCATAHVQQVGDGGCAFVLLLHALLLEASRTLAALPLAQQAQQKAVTASALRELESSVLPRVLVRRLPPFLPVPPSSAQRCVHQQLMSRVHGWEIGRGSSFVALGFLPYVV